MKYSDVPDYDHKPLSADAPTVYGEDVYVGYRFYDTKGVAPMYPFGHGLSYTSFAYGSVKLGYSTFNLDRADETLGVSVDVTNTGKVAGKEVVELYVSDLHARIDRPAKELKGFSKTKLLAPGEKETVTFTLHRADLSYFDEYANDWRADAGFFRVIVGGTSDAKLLASKGLSADFRAQSAKTDYAADMDMSILTSDRDAYDLVRDFYGLDAFDYPTGGWFAPPVPAPSLQQRAVDLNLPAGTVDRLVAELKKL